MGTTGWERQQLYPFLFCISLPMYALQRVARRGNPPPPSIQPEPLPHPTLPGGPLHRRWFLYRLQGKTKTGGMTFPNAFTAQARDTRTPRSPDVITLYCLAPRHAITWSGVWTVVMPVSSIFHISFPSILCFSITCPRFLKNLPTLLRLKLMAGDGCLCTSDRQIWVAFHET